MKKQLLLIIAIAISTLAMAQTQPTFGVRAGLSSATLKGDAVENLQNVLDYTKGMVSTTSHTGFFVGGYASIPVSEIFSVEPALYYSQKGYEMKGELNLKGLPFLGATAKAKLNTQYIDLPVVLKADISGFQIFAGPQISYLANANLQTTAGVLGINLLNKKLDATQQFNKWDAALTGGVGYKFMDGINVTASYDYGLSRVDANKMLNSYNRSFKVGIGYSF